MRKWITFPLTQGDHSRQAHCDLPAGTYEREAGREGFFGPATQFHHAHPPTAWSDWEGPLRPRAFNLNKLDEDCASPWDAVALLGNAQVELRWWHCARSMDFLARNADGDELLFVHRGSGHLFCDYGHLQFRDGDYLLLPRGTAWRVELDEPLDALLIQASNGAYQMAERGIVGNQAIFDPAVLDTPMIDAAFTAQQTDDPWRIVIKRGGKLSTLTYPFNPLDAIGWHGDLCAVRLNWRDIRPLMSHRYHVPPSAHVTFVANSLVVCTFVPRPIESDPGALKVPFYHSNDDYDEVIFYHQGTFFSRDNIEPGMVTLHPCGFPHGPHPKAFAAGATRARDETDEVAVMIDTRDALSVSALPDGVEDSTYVDSWKLQES